MYIYVRTQVYILCVKVVDSLYQTSTVFNLDVCNMKANVQYVGI